MKALLQAYLDSKPRTAGLMAIESTNSNSSEDWLLACNRANFGSINNLDDCLNNYCLFDSDTALTYCCRNGQTDSVKKLLLHTKLDINKTCKQGLSPFMLAATNLHLDICKLLILRADLNLGNGSAEASTAAAAAAADGVVGTGNSKLTYMDYALMTGETVLIKLLLLRDVITTSCLTVGSIGSGDCHPLIKLYQQQPTVAKQQFANSLKLSLSDIPISSTTSNNHNNLKIGYTVFALTVCLCDNYLSLKPVVTTTVDKLTVDKLTVATTVVAKTTVGSSAIEQTCATDNTRRYFHIMQRLPMDLQAVICYRLIGSAKTVITSDNFNIGLSTVLSLVH